MTTIDDDSSSDRAASASDPESSVAAHDARAT